MITDEFLSKYALVVAVRLLTQGSYKDDSGEVICYYKRDGSHPDLLEQIGEYNVRHRKTEV